jgi:hypothetical protein
VKSEYSTYYSVVKAPSFSIELLEAGKVEGSGLFILLLNQNVSEGLMAGASLSTWGTNLHMDGNINAWQLLPFPISHCTVLYFGTVAA